jgi:hypothetical protein
MHATRWAEPPCKDSYQLSERHIYPQPILIRNASGRPLEVEYDYNSSFTPQNTVQRSNGVNGGPCTLQIITRDKFQFIPRSK